MRKRYAAALICAMASSASASMYLYEPFDYTDSTGLGAGGHTDTYVTPNRTWVKAGATNEPLASPTGSLSYPLLPASVGNAAMTGGAGNASNSSFSRIPFRDAVDSAVGPVVYYSMIVQVPTGVASFGGNTAGGSFFSGLNYNPDISPLNNSTSTSGAALCIRQDVTGGGYNLGVVYKDTGSRQFATTKFLAGDTHYLVIRYDSGLTDNTAGNTNDAFDDKAWLWIDPDLSQPEPGLPVGVGASTAASINFVGSGFHDYFYTQGTGVWSGATGVKSVHLRDNTLEPTNIKVDELRVADSWNDVTGTPEPGALTILGLGALGLIARRRQRKA